ncbi:MAG: hypothetical protein SFX73_10455 [Kofleriaceae bacterium]|nr:hypothetical protein [Kofleriaceae bacterium]
MRPASGSLLAAVLFGLSTVAHADDVDVIVTGDATSQPRITAQVEDWLHNHGRTLAASALAPDALDQLIDCFAIDDQTCASHVVNDHATAGAVVVVNVEVDTDEGARTITLRGHWFTKDQPALAETRTCEACTDATLRSAVAELVAALDGRAMPVVSAPPAVPPLVTPPPGRASRTLPYALIGGGAALLVTGITLVAITENDTGDKYLYYDGRNRTAGFVLGTLGLAAASTGAYLYVKARRSADSVPSVALLPGGAYVGWARSF